MSRANSLQPTIRAPWDRFNKGTTVSKWLLAKGRDISACIAREGFRLQRLDVQGSDSIKILALNYRSVIVVVLMGLSFKCRDGCWGQ